MKFHEMLLFINERLQTARLQSYSTVRLALTPAKVRICDSCISFLKKENFFHVANKQTKRPRLQRHGEVMQLFRFIKENHPKISTEVNSGVNKFCISLLFCPESDYYFFCDYYKELLL